MVTGIQTDGIEQLWPIVSVMLKPALAEGETLEKLKAQLYMEEAQLWAIYEHGEVIAAVVTECVGEEASKVCNIWAAGGKGINRWADYADMIEDWARENGCTAVIVEKTRKGMQRILKGYTVTHVTLKKEL